MRMNDLHSCPWIISGGLLSAFTWTLNSTWACEGIQFRGQKCFCCLFCFNNKDFIPGKCFNIVFDAWVSSTSDYQC